MMPEVSRNISSHQHNVESLVGNVNFRSKWWKRSIKYRIKRQWQINSCDKAMQLYQQITHSTDNAPMVLRRSSALQKRESDLFHMCWWYKVDGETKVLAPQPARLCWWTPSHWTKPCSSSSNNTSLSTKSTSYWTSGRLVTQAMPFEEQATLNSARLVYFCFAQLHNT